MCSRVTGLTATAPRRSPALDNGDHLACCRVFDWEIRDGRLRDATGELRARLHIELPERLPEVVLDRPRADQPLSGDLAGGVALRREARDLPSCGVSWWKVSTVLLRARSRIASSSILARSAKASIAVRLSIDGVSAEGQRDRAHRLA